MTNTPVFKPLSDLPRGKDSDGNECLMLKLDSDGTELLNDEFCQKATKLFEEQVEAATLDKTAETLGVVVEELANVKEVAEQTLDVVEQTVEAQVDEMADQLIGKIDQYLHYAVEETIELHASALMESVAEVIHERQLHLIEAVDLLARSVFTSADEYQEWYAAVAQAAEASAVDGSSPGSRWAAGVPDDAVLRNRRSVGGSRGSHGTASNGDRQGVVKEETLVQTDGGDIVSLDQYKQAARINKYVAFMNRGAGLPPVQSPNVVDAASMPQEQARQILAEEAGVDVTGRPTQAEADAIKMDVYTRVMNKLDQKRAEHTSGIKVR
jgi:hypothetical protein